MLNHYITYYVANTQGIDRLKTLMKQRKGTTVLDHVSVEDFIYPAFIPKNQEKAWSHTIKIATMDEEEREKFRDYNRTIAWS